MFSPRPDFSPPPALRSRVGSWVTPIQASPSLVGPEDFSFFGCQGSLDYVGWDGPARDKLWRYNQHYFRDLNAPFSRERHKWHVEILEKWVAQNQPAIGVGWEPYPISLRIVNWIKWSFAGNVLPAECIRSLAIQARFLSKRLEWHLLGNHLLSNAKALVFAGIFFGGEEAENWLSSGLHIIQSELAEQILSDGGHFERSTMYHAVVLEDVLDLVNIAQISPGSIDDSARLEWRNIVIRMIAWLQVMTHPDGQISFFNDAALDIAPPLENLLEYAHLLGIQTSNDCNNPPLKIISLKETGYIRIACNSAVALLDVAQVGPDYLPGHAHADTLSFELSLFSQRVIVNGGTSQYGVGPNRIRERQTGAHSTVEVDGVSSSEVWGGFRVARRAKPICLKIDSMKEEIFVGCSHNGYERLKGGVIHRREWRMTANDLMISDLVTGGEYKSIARFILHPSIHIERLGSNDWYIYTSSGKRILFNVLNGNGFIEMTTYAPKFGVVLETSCLAINLNLGRSQARFQWN